MNNTVLNLIVRTQMKHLVLFRLLHGKGVVMSNTKKEIAYLIATAWFPENEGESSRKANYIVRLMRRTKEELEDSLGYANEILEQRKQS